VTNRCETFMRIPFPSGDTRVTSRSQPAPPAGTVKALVSVAGSFSHLGGACYGCLGDGSRQERLHRRWRSPGGASPATRVRPLCPANAPSWHRKWALRRPLLSHRCRRSGAASFRGFRPIRAATESDVGGCGARSSCSACGGVASADAWLREGEQREQDALPGAPLGRRPFLASRQHERAMAAHVVEGARIARR